MPTPDRPAFRFAPSPNGYLHLGHALSALTGFEMARAASGRFLLRIEDIDLARAREEFVQAIHNDLAWLGLSWEQPVLRQSQRFAEYRLAAESLDRQGLLYPCFATRSEIAAALKGFGDGVDPDGAPLYPGLHKELAASQVRMRLAAGEPYALRLHMDRAVRAATTKLAGRRLSFTEIGEGGRESEVQAVPEKWGDVVVVRKDVPASYHLAVVVDDAQQGITHVTRGRDLYEATHLHRLLQVLLGLPEPRYHHHRLITDSARRKLSKSAGDTSLRALREAGLDAHAIRRLAVQV